MQTQLRTVPYSLVVPPLASQNSTSWQLCRSTDSPQRVSNVAWGGTCQGSPAPYLGTLAPACRTSCRAPQPQTRHWFAQENSVGRQPRSEIAPEWSCKNQVRRNLLWRCAKKPLLSRWREICGFRNLPCRICRRLAQQLVKRQALSSTARPVATLHPQLSDSQKPPPSFTILCTTTATWQLRNISTSSQRLLP